MTREEWAAEAVRRVERTVLMHGGTATWAQLRAGGTGRAALAHAITAGSVRPLVRGVYCASSASAALRAAVAHGGVVSHTTAAAHWCLESVSSPTAVHVTVPRGCRRQASRGTRLHWIDLDPADVVGDDQGGVTSVVRTVLDCARVLPFAEALAVADSALRRGACDADELRDRAARLRGGGSGRVRRVVLAADGRAANPLESVLRAVVITTGVGGFTPQLEIRLGGSSRWVDLGDPHRRMVLEADSFAFHGTRQALDRDCRRYSDLVADGWSVLRFSYEQVLHDRSWVADRVTTLAADAQQRSRGRPRRRPLARA